MRRQFNEWFAKKKEQVRKDKEDAEDATDSMTVNKVQSSSGKKGPVKDSAAND
jgi:hypothetical protein